jgi:hypothetical protein
VCALIDREKMLILYAFFYDDILLLKKKKKNSYFLGKRAADEGRVARYADIDFCKDPGAICSRSEHPELKWIAGMFYWISSLQPYDNGWNYLDELKLFVDHGMKDDAFIDAVSGIVNRGKSERNVSSFLPPLSFQLQETKSFCSFFST